MPQTLGRLLLHAHQGIFFHPCPGIFHDTQQAIVPFHAKLKRYMEDHSFYNAIFVDLPDPDGPEMIKLYNDTIELMRAHIPWFDSVGFAMHVGPAIINPESPQRQIIKEFQTLLKNTIATNLWVETCYVPSFSNEWAFLYGARNFNGGINSNLALHVFETCKFWQHSKQRPVDRDLGL